MPYMSAQAVPRGPMPLVEVEVGDGVEVDGLALGSINLRGGKEGLPGPNHGHVVP